MKQTVVFFSFFICYYYWMNAYEKVVFLSVVVSIFNDQNTFQKSTLVLKWYVCFFFRYPLLTNNTNLLKFIWFNLIHITPRVDWLRHVPSSYVFFFVHCHLIDKCVSEKYELYLFYCETVIRLRGIINIHNGNYASKVQGKNNE